MVSMIVSMVMVSGVMVRSRIFWWSFMVKCGEYCGIVRWWCGFG